MGNLDSGGRYGNVSFTVLYLPLAMVPGLREDFVVAAVILAVISEMNGV